MRQPDEFDFFAYEKQQKYRESFRYFKELVEIANEDTRDFEKHKGRIDEFLERQQDRTSAYAVRLFAFLDSAQEAQKFADKITFLARFRLLGIYWSFYKWKGKNAKKSPSK